MENLSEVVNRLERVIKKRPDKEAVKDFPDGATLCELAI
jgi:hypothetical protein